MQSRWPKATRVSTRALFRMEETRYFPLRWSRHYKRWRSFPPCVVKKSRSGWFWSSFRTIVDSGDDISQVETSRDRGPTLQGCLVKLFLLPVVNPTSFEQSENDRCLARPWNHHFEIALKTCKRRKESALSTSATGRSATSKIRFLDFAWRRPSSGYGVQRLRV